MSKRNLALGEHGDIDLTPQLRDAQGKWKRHPTGKGKTVERWRGRAYYRGHDGLVSDVSRVAPTRLGALAAVKQGLAERLTLGSGGTTTSTLLVDAGKAWLAHIDRSDSGKSDRTRQDYRRTFCRYIDAQGSSLRGLTLSQANSAQRLRGFLQTVADQHGTGSARATKSVLSGILGQAVNDGVLPMNAARQVRPVKAQTVKATARARDTSRAFTREERDAIIAHADALAAADGITASTRRKRQAAADLLAFMAGTGVRITEARSLRWEHVHGSYVHVHGTKSKASRRRVDLPSWLAVRLQDRAGRTGTDGLVFASPHLSDTEATWDQSNCAKALSEVLVSAGYPWATPHTFRRTVATLLHDAGAPIARIADTLGHSDPSMTASVYLGRDFEGDKSGLAAML